MHTLSKQSIAIVLAIVCCQVAAGQKIQCSLNQTSDQYEASLAWRNTLGATKANALCATSNGNRTKSNEITESDEQIDTNKKTTPKALPNANLNQTIEFISVSGDTASSALNRWAIANNYKSEWNLPENFNASVSPGSFRAASFIDGVAKFIVGLNDKNKEKNIGKVEFTLVGNIVKINQYLQTGTINPILVSTQKPEVLSIQFDVVNTDQTIRDVLVRWSNASNWVHKPEHWTIDRDLPITGTSNGFQFGNDFVTATRKLLETTEMTDRPLQPCFYSNKILRVVNKAEICDKSK